jgi:hypothetical protein
MFYVRGISVSSSEEWILFKLKIFLDRINRIYQDFFGRSPDESDQTQSPSAKKHFMRHR